MNLGQKALQVLKTVAPTLALGALGPFGPLAAAAIHAVLGTSTDEQAETALLTATPEQLLALKKAENDFQIQIKTLGIAEEKLSFDDLASARAREVAVKDSTPRQMAWLIVGGSIALGVATVAGFTTKDPAAATMVGTVIGYVFGEAKQVLSYYFGSSSGSAAKTDTINKIAETK
jgi:hypothetical protein